MIIRPMRPDDVEEAERLSAAAFLEVDRRTRRPDDPEPAARAPARARAWVERTTGLVDTDGGGCWVADDETAADGALLGFASSLRRETLWCLATFAVRAGARGQGVGRALLEAALQHSHGCLRGMLSSSEDPAAVRSYHRAGFALHPQMRLSGTVDRSVLPVVERVREGTVSDRDLMDSVDRGARGAAHGVDHAHLLSLGRLLVVDTAGASGYAYTDGTGVAVLAATDRRTAARLLWTALADAPGPLTVEHVTGANQWALDVGLTAGLELRQSGYLGVRGMAPPAPYLHHGALL